ncbi:MAG: DNA polymerase III subunit alpha [Akkermansiaceae bacterium]|nr:DNA polymerase III subunit alpha [Akkermansiaceae bacterium]
MPTELHARSCFSFLRGASQPEDLIHRAAELGYDSLALPDHMGVYGSARAHAAAKECGLRALVGATLELPGLEVPVLVRNRPGYRNLCRLLTDLHCEPDGAFQAPNPAGHDQLLPSQRDADSPPPAGHRPLTTGTTGLVALLTPESLPNPGRENLLETATWLRDTFGEGNLYIELTRHHVRGEERRNTLLRDLAEHLRLPLLASNAPLFARRRDRFLADAFTSLRHHTTLDAAGTLLAANPERHLKHPRQVADLFRDHPEALLNTERLAGRLEFTLENLGYKFPSYHENGRPLTPDEEAFLLREQTLRGARQRYGKLRQNVRQQIEHELALIAKLGFSGYFLIVWEIVQFAQSQGILCQGRGSAANSAVCYALGITACDPVGGGLLFERFLSENRKSWPDIDIDFPSGDRREAVIQHVFQKYAPRGAAMTANVITYRPRSAFREMSKVLGFPDDIADRFSDLSASPKVHDSSGRDGEWHDRPGHDQTPPSQRDANSTRNTGPEVSMSNFYPKSKVVDLEATIEQAGVPRTHPRFRPLLHLYHTVLGFPRHLGQHSGGMIICDDGLDSIVPLQPAAMPNRTIVQWDKDDCEDLGIVKVDLLGLGMLAAMEDALRICAQRGRPVDLATIPKDDPATFDMLGRADTIGTFQVESRAQMATLPIMRPRNFYDLAIEVAIIRPGPIVGDLVHPYLNRRNGREPVDYIHPAFEPVLGRTLGVPLFQEQVLRMAMIIAGFDGAEADELRRAMAFKRSDERMEAIAHKLRRRMSERNVDLLVQDKVVKAIGSFALYGFPESHAISFALIAYASCWLKVHRPAEFYAGLINNQPMGFYSVATLLRDAGRHGIRTRPVSVLHSDCETTVLDDGEGKTLRLGLHRLKGLAAATADRIVEARSRRQFTSLPDFLRRSRPNKKERRLLAAAGALNGLPEVEHRREGLWQVEKDLHDDLFSVERQRAAEEASAYQWHDPSGHDQDSPVPRTRDAPSQPETGNPEPEPSRIQDRRSPSGIEHPTSGTKSPLPPMSPMERLSTDYATQGHTTGPHPMALWRRQLATGPRPPATAPVRAADFSSIPHGKPVTTAGMVICRQRPGTAKGHCFISLEDETGIANLFVPRDTFHACRLIITSEPFLLCHGRLQVGEGGTRTLYTTAVEPLHFPADLASSSHDFH